MSINLVSPYPAAEGLKTNLKFFSEKQIEGFARLWLSEGIPFAFKDNPMVYEEIRDFIAFELNLFPKEITLIGSARIGISLSPDNYGKEFSTKSDHDFSIISESLFSKCRIAFETWKFDFENKKISPLHDKEMVYWPQNCGIVPKNIARGFIDPYKIPNRNEYQPAGQISDLTFKLKTKYQLTAPGFRIYKDWESFFRQMKININSLLNNI